MRMGLFAAACLVLAGTAADAATLSGVQGEVLANQGNGFFRATSGQQLQTGDQVMVQPGGSANIVYRSGLTQAIPSGGVFTVPSEEVTGAVPPAAAAAPGLSSTALVIGGVAAVGGGVAIAASSGGGSKSTPGPTPSSP